jgi:hypothetical protein
VVQQFLDVAQIGPAFQQVRGVAKAVRGSAGVVPAGVMPETYCRAK